MTDTGIPQTGSVAVLAPGAGARPALKFGVVVFPGTWSDRDCGWVVDQVLGQELTYLWHKDRDLKRCDCVILPGGFAYGDYLRTGAIARFAPVMEAVSEFADRGGLVFPPRLGFFENVAELDFISEFPNIMARFNVSPETVNCPCCPEAPRVPELGYRICQKRRGITSRVVERLIAKRGEFKRRMKTSGLGTRDSGLVAPGFSPAPAALKGGATGLSLVTCHCFQEDFFPLNEPPGRIFSASL